MVLRSLEVYAYSERRSTPSECQVSVASLPPAALSPLPRTRKGVLVVKWP